MSIGNLKVPLCLLCVIACVQTVHAASPNHSFVKQGYSLKVQMSNVGTFGRIAYPPFTAFPYPPEDSIGVEYFLGEPAEHVWGAGLWIGGMLDTTQNGTGSRLKLVSTAYEGWAGPYYEFFPGDSPADTFWQATGRGAPKPPGWNEYWGESLPYKPMGHENSWCTYTDTSVAVFQHVPLRLKVIQSAHSWRFLEPMMILEYRIMNVGRRTIDSMYVGMFFDGDVGPIAIPNYWQANCSGFYPDLRLAYVQNYYFAGSTPVGIRLIGTSIPYDTISFYYSFPTGPPRIDASRYFELRQGIRPDECPNSSDTRFWLSVGPFPLRPVTLPDKDTLTLTFALVSGQTLAATRQNAVFADSLYRIPLEDPIEPPGFTIPRQFALFQNYPNPFNPSTTIEFDVASAAIVNIRIYDVLGREVATLVNERLSPRRYARVWDASGLPSGVYYVRLTAGDFSAVRKLVLVR